MGDNYFNDVKKLIEEHKAIREKNLKLADLLNRKMLEVRQLRESESKLQCQIRDALTHTVNVENISGSYMELKEKYKKVIDEKNTVEDLSKRKEEELLGHHQKQIKLYQDMLAKEQEKYKLKETEYCNELKKTSTALNEQVQQIELKWKMLLEDANRQLKDLNLSCTTLRAQLVHTNQKHTNVDFLEKKVRELESKLEQKENELRLARQALYIKDNYKIPSSPPRDLYRTNNKRGPYKIPQKSPSPNVSGDAPPNPAGENCFRYNMLNINLSNKHHPPSLSESAPENSVRNTSLNTSLKNKHSLPNSCESTPVKEVPQKLKKRKLYDPHSALMDYMSYNPSGI